MMPDETQSQGFQIETEPETSAEVPSPASNTIPQTASAEHLPTACRDSLRAPSVPVPPQNSPLRQAKPRRKGGPGPFRPRRIDRLILGYCAHGPTEVSGLKGEIANGTLYRRLGKLVKSGALKRVGRRYHTTAVGQRWLAEELAHIEWTIFDHLYPPFAHIPTPYHKALLELVLAAAVVRQAGLHADHLCAFVVMGGTLRWKTSLGRMACATLGVDPSVSLIDLASEAGRSVFVRRTSDGHLRSERNVLSSRLVIFDDFLQASDALRAAVGPFLSGRRTVPYENGVIAVDCVTLLTMNPRAKATPEQQTTLNPAQLRRAIVCNVDAVPMPDLSLTGHRAVEVALQHGPLTLPVLRTDFQEHRAAVVQVVRDVVRPEMHDRIDTEMLRILAAGMRGFIDDDERAVQQTLYNFGLMLETLGWARPDWVTTVSEFSLLRPRPTPIKPPPIQPPSTPDTEDGHDHILLRRRIMTTPNSDSAPYILSEESRARLILMAAEERISFTQAADVIIDSFTCSTTSVGRDLHDLHSILELSKDLKVRELPVKSVKLTLQLLAYLKEHQLSFDDFEPAISLLARLHEFGLTAQASEVTRILEVACELVTSGVPSSEVEQWLARRPNASPQ
ncbi:MAG: hypothetical protein ND866_28590 [Pyrinomonadaceae bacterium]|nr:hypothetical protein [Pyrinomonadaceae bacterium]